MTKAKAKTNIVANIFGILGYLSTVLVWLWAVVLVLPWLMSLQAVKDFTTPTHQEAIQPIVSYQAPSQTEIFLIIAVAFVIVILGIVAAIRMPRKFISSTSRTTHKVATQLAVELTHQHPVEKKKLTQITEDIVWAIKLSLVIVPFIGIYLSSLYVPMTLDRGIALGVGVYVTAWPLLWFGLQYIFARLHHTETTL